MGARLEDLKRRILEAFAARARRSGLRDVGMGELARDLSMSTRTIYREFSGKAEIVHGLLEQLAESFEAKMEAEPPATREAAEAELVELITRWFSLWDTFPEVFWTQLQTDYPASHTFYLERQDRNLERARARLAALAHPDFSRELTELCLSAAVRAARDEAWRREMNLTYRDAVTQIVRLWASAALKARA